LKHDIHTRHIPVCVISTDEARERALNGGALAFIAKPIQSRDLLDVMLSQLMGFVTRARRNVLLVEPNETRLRDIQAAITCDNVLVACANDGPSAIKALDEQTFDCVIMNPEVRDLDKDAFAQIIDQRFRHRPLPMVMYGEQAAVNDAYWRPFNDLASVRRIHSPERLLDQTMLALHREVATLSEPQRLVLRDLHLSDKLLAGKKVLIVDDDMRNIFALTTVLEEHDMVIASADNGRAAIRMLQEQPDVDIVLMDIMMPEMDGIDTMREIRKLSEFRNLPIVAVTAKAMKGDREKCIEAGAWDYLAKPVDTEQLLAVLRAWLHR
jgi:CheY-like chemotaxis protein